MCACRNNKGYVTSQCHNAYAYITGTLLTAFSVFCCGTTTRLESRLMAFAFNIVAGLLQLMTFLVIVGWIWSISWGMTFVQLASQYNRMRLFVAFSLLRVSRASFSVNGN